MKPPSAAALRAAKNLGFNPIYPPLQAAAAIDAELAPVVDILQRIDTMWSDDGYEGPDSEKSLSLFTKQTLRLWRELRNTLKDIS